MCCSFKWVTRMLSVTLDMHNNKHPLRSRAPYWPRLYCSFSTKSFVISQILYKCHNCDVIYQIFFSASAGPCGSHNISTLWVEGMWWWVLALWLWEQGLCTRLSTDLLLLLLLHTELEDCEPLFAIGFSIVYPVSICNCQIDMNLMHNTGLQYF